MTDMTVDRAGVGRPVVWRFDNRSIALLVLSLVSYLVLYADVLLGLEEIWQKREEYSYGYLIPFIAAFLVWQRKDKIERIPFSGNVWGIGLLLLGLAVYVLGKLSTFSIIMQYSLVVVLYGYLLAYTGLAGLKVMWVPVFFLLFMIPIPSFLISELSALLQLWSSQIGVWVIRLFGISVFLEGNVIDLGVYKLQVVEACSGLRYLFPLMALGFMAAYFFNASFWKKAVLFLSTIPISILMNSFRIGAIGVMVEYWGVGMAEGFLHDFEGWVVFMACLVLLILEIWVLSRIGGEPIPFNRAFAIDWPAPTPKDAEIRYRPINGFFVIATIMLGAAAIADKVWPEKEPFVPERRTFAEFPLQLGDWVGHEDRLEQVYLDVLLLDDYLLANYRNRRDGSYAGVYIAYHDSQQGKKTSHTPKSCLPGGGWEIEELKQYEVPGVNVNGRPLKVNRVVIEKGDVRQLVYYWFKQRDRIITNEYLLKFYIFWDSIFRNRTDGALIRITTFVGPAETMEEADQRLKSLVSEIVPILNDYVPN